MAVAWMVLPVWLVHSVSFGRNSFVGSRHAQLAACVALARPCHVNGLYSLVLRANLKMWRFGRRVRDISRHRCMQGE